MPVALAVAEAPQQTVNQLVPLEAKAARSRMAEVVQPEPPEAARVATALP